MTIPPPHLPTVVSKFVADVTFTWRWTKERPPHKVLAPSIRWSIRLKLMVYRSIVRRLNTRSAPISLIGPPCFSTKLLVHKNGTFLGKPMSQSQHLPNDTLTIVLRQDLFCFIGELRKCMAKSISWIQTFPNRGQQSLCHIFREKHTLIFYARVSGKIQKDRRRV